MRLRYVPGLTHCHNYYLCASSPFRWKRRTAEIQIKCNNYFTSNRASEEIDSILPLSLLGFSSPMRNYYRPIGCQMTYRPRRCLMIVFILLISQNTLISNHTEKAPLVSRTFLDGPKIAGKNLTFRRSYIQWN